MKKAKNILNINNIARAVVVLAVILVVIALVLFLTRNNGVGSDSTDDGYRSIVVVSSGDTLSKLPTGQGFSNAEVLEIA